MILPLTGVENSQEVYNREMRVLLIEDNLLTVRGLTYLLEKEGFLVRVADSVKAVRELISGRGISGWRYDLILLDVGLADGDGFAVAREVRELGLETPIIFLTARDDESSVVRGFDLGADDYVVKPFRNRELMSRIRAVLRRRGKVTEVVKCGELTLDVQAGVLLKNGVGVALSALEYKIVVVLMLNAGMVVRRERLLDEIWDFAGNVVNDNTLTVYIKRIREKIGEEMIETVKGIGYRIPNRGMMPGPREISAYHSSGTGVKNKVSAYDFSDREMVK